MRDNTTGQQERNVGIILVQCSRDSSAKYASRNEA